MIIQADESGAQYQIQKYQPGCIVVNNISYKNSIIIRPFELISDWKPNQLSEVTLADLASIYAAPPQILLLGTGSALIIPEEQLLLPLYAQGIGVEFMDSRAACYTFTILAAEQRSVAACILIN